MTFLDPKWLEILKASGWQTGAIALACLLFLLAGHWGWLPPLAPWMVQLAAFVMLVTGLLAAASTIIAILKAFPVQVWIIRAINIWREQRSVREYIPHMTPHERKIIAYLLAKNQMMLTGGSDGGYAKTLISRGIIVRALIPGQVVPVTDVPFAIPDHVWDVLIAHRDQFPYTPPRRGGEEPHPWRVPWMAK